MKRMLLGALVGGVILFFWSFLAWVVLPLHEPSLRAIPNEDAVMATLQSSLKTRSVYIFPKNPGSSADAAAQAAWTDKMKRGPTGLIFFDPTGTDPMMPGQFACGMLLDIISAFVAAWFLARSTAAGSSYMMRVAFCGMFGIFTAVFVHLMNWNWMGFPADFTTGQIIDAIVSWILAGLGIAAFVKSAEPAQTA